MCLLKTALPHGMEMRREDDSLGVKVRKTRDGYLVFTTKGGVEIYDVAIVSFRKHLGDWLRQLQGKSWFTAALEEKCLRLSEVIK